MKKILILGSNSDIGISLLSEIVKTKDYIIHAHYNKNFPKKKIKQKIKLIKRDLNKLNEKNLKSIFDNDYDVVVNLVGYVGKKNFLKFDNSEITKTLKINSIFPMLIIRNCLKKMIKKRYGRIINTSSIGVKFGGGNSFAYSLSKHVNEFIPNYIRKLSSKNVFYNTLRIGVTDTKIHKKIGNKSLKKRIKLIPVQKMANKNDIAKYIFYLIKDNNFITNEIINITGGE